MPKYYGSWRLVPLGRIIPRPSISQLSSGAPNLHELVPFYKPLEPMLLNWFLPKAKTLESKLINADIVRENFKVFRDVFEHLTQEEKFDLMHLLIKKVVYFEEDEGTRRRERRGNIKMDLWELPPIDPSMINSAKPSDLNFAESSDWLPGRDSNPRQGD